MALRTAAFRSAVTPAFLPSVKGPTATASWILRRQTISLLPARRTLANYLGAPCPIGISAMVLSQALHSLIRRLSHFILLSAKRKVRLYLLASEGHTWMN